MKKVNRTFTLIIGIIVVLGIITLAGIHIFFNDGHITDHTVTIVADEESTGKNFYYKENGITFDNCPVDDFINLSGNPVFESLDSLMEGESIVDSMKNMNYSRVAENYCRLRYRNIDKFSLSFKIKR